MEVNGVECTFHHLGIPTADPRPGERYSERFGMFTSDSPCQAMRVQWHRFEAQSTLHPLIRTVPHVAFKVSDLDRAIEGFPILLGPYEPIPGFRVAIVEDSGHPIEFVQTAFTDKEIWGQVAGKISSRAPEPHIEFGTERRPVAAEENPCVSLTSPPPTR